MAHFAEIKQKQDPTGFTTDTHWVVERVVVVGNDIPTSNGPLENNDMHVDGETWCQNFFKGGTWKQTSYNNNFRGKYAGVNMVYDYDKDIFIMPQPYKSWTLNANNNWQAPNARPSIEVLENEVLYIIGWNESKYEADNTKGWEAYKSDDSNIPKTVYNWNGTAWVAE
jgi:hypothetical protein